MDNIMKKIIKTTILKTLALSTLGLTLSTQAMEVLSDQELARIEAQALLSMHTNYDVGQNIKFHKLSLEALMELNVNIKTLQLGCGGINGKDACDIDISNIALSGLSSNLDTTGNPQFSERERAATSASITNPFIEFAISGTEASTREVLGFRLGAEKIIGLLTLGVENSDSPNDGIKQFSGYMKMAETSGYAYTQATKFGNTNAEKISGTLTALGQNRVYTSSPGSDGHTGITVPSMKANFVMPETIVTGKRLTQAKVEGIRSTIPSIPLAAFTGTMPDVVIPEGQQATWKPDFSQDQLYVTFPALLGSIGDHALFKMGEGSSLDNLNLDITFIQSLNLIHNIPLSGTGGYLSLQSRPIQWLGADEEDVAQAGWWMSFKDPIQLGKLQTEKLVDVSSVFPQVAQALTSELMNTYHNVDVTFLEAISSVLAKTPIQRTMNINVGEYTNYYNGSPAKLVLENQVLKNQNVTPNCFGGHKFC